jgi:anthranilate/para-aminobenzoate synthase component I
MTLTDPQWRNVVEPTIAISCRRTEVDRFNPLATYLAYHTKIRAGDSYLLESLSGPEDEQRISQIGFAPLFSVSVSGRQVALEGNPEVVGTLIRRCLETETLTGIAGELQLASRRDLWKLLRLLESSFDLGGIPEPERRSGFGWFGYLGYDVIHSVEDIQQRIEPDAAGCPDLRLTVFQGVLTLDLGSSRGSLQWWYDATTEDGRNGEHVMFGGLVKNPATDEHLDVVPPISIHRSMSREEYLDRALRALEYVRSGDVYQVQVGHELSIDSAADPFTVYRRLRHRNPSPYMYYSILGDITLIGASPEVLVRVERNQCLMRPLAGTIARGANPTEDARNAQALRADQKEIAEHIMLVDLCRNDVNRICEPWSLRVSDLLVVQNYSHVSHLASTVCGRVRDGIDHFNVIAAVLPSGTMTGAPKIRAVEIIELLENSRRGVYSGAVGKIGFSGEVNLAICIRSAVHRKGRYSLRASAGVVAESRPEREWRETWHKLAAPLWAVTGQEILT